MCVNRQALSGDALLNAQSPKLMSYLLSTSTGVQLVKKPKTIQEMSYFPSTLLYSYSTQLLFLHNTACNAIIISFSITHSIATLLHHFSVKLHYFLQHIAKKSKLINIDINIQR